MGMSREGASSLVSKLPLCSSGQVAQVLKRAGFEKGKKVRGSHQRYLKTRSDGTQIVTVLVEGRKVIPRGTLNSILTLAEISEAEFLRLLK